MAYLTSFVHPAPTLHQHSLATTECSHTRYVQVRIQDLYQGGPNEILPTLRSGQKLGLKIGVRDERNASLYNIGNAFKWSP